MRDSVGDFFGSLSAAVGCGANEAVPIAAEVMKKACSISELPAEGGANYRSQLIHSLGHVMSPGRLQAICTVMTPGDAD
jgi:hypothetical protein